MTCENTTTATREGHGPPRALIITPNADRSASLHVRLRDKGYAPVWASTGLEALNLLRMGVRGPVLFDSNLPDVDPDTVLDRIARVMPSALLVLLSGPANDDDAIHLMHETA